MNSNYILNNAICILHHISFLIVIYRKSLDITINFKTSDSGNWRVIFNYRIAPIYLYSLQHIDTTIRRATLLIMNLFSNDHIVFKETKKEAKSYNVDVRYLILVKENNDKFPDETCFYKKKNKMNLSVKVTQYFSTLSINAMG